MGWNFATPGIGPHQCPGMCLSSLLRDAVSRQSCPGHNTGAAGRAPSLSEPVLLQQLLSVSILPPWRDKATPFLSPKTAKYTASLFLFLMWQALQTCHYLSLLPWMHQMAQVLLHTGDTWLQMEPHSYSKVLRDSYLLRSRPVQCPELY